MIDGKAKLIRDDYCDGLGNCLPACPTGAITFVEREAAAYDEKAVEEHQKRLEAVSYTHLLVYYIATFKTGAHSMLLLSVGRILYSDFGLFYQVPMDSGMLFNTTTTIDTFVYRGRCV